MRQPSALAEVPTRFADGGPVEGIRVRARDVEAEVENLVPFAVVMAGFLGVVMGIVGTNPSLVTSWLR